MSVWCVLSYFSLQPNIDTRRKQIEAWCDLILSYYKQKKLYMLDITEALSNELFYNKKIDSILWSDHTILIKILH